MINFTDDRLYVKGTCNVLLSDPVSGDIYFQSDKMSTGNITPSTNLNEIRAGLGNPIACMIPSDAGLAVDFDSASFSLWAKSAQLGASLTYGAPVWACQTVTATGEAITIDVTGGIPVAELGKDSAVCFVQEVNAASPIATDGTSYPISSAGAISGFSATNGKKYKIWYHKQNVAAKVAKIYSLIDPKVVRFEAQIAVYSNKGGGASSQGTRVGWLYYTIPYMKLQGDATVTGDQNNNDTTKISGQAIAYDEAVISDTCSDCDMSTLGYIVYVPDDGAEEIKGLAVVGGVTSVVKSTTAILPIRFVMADGSLVAPSYPYTGFTFTLADNPPSGTSIASSGLITAGSTAGDTEITSSYAIGESSITCVSNLSVTNS